MNNIKLKSTVVIPFFNGNNFIFETIDSLQKQTRPVDEIIVVDDGSVLSESLDVLQRIRKEDSDIKIIHQKNVGISGAMTAGAKMAMGDIIFQIDCDDIVDKNYVKKYMDVFESDDNIDAVTSYYNSFFDNKDNSHYTYKPTGLSVPQLFFENCAGGANSAFRKSVLEKIGYWDERYRSFQDWGMWLKFVEYDLKLHIIPEVLYYYRVHDNSDTRTEGVNFELEKNIKISMARIIDKDSEMFVQKVYTQLRDDNRDACELEKRKREIENMKKSHFWKMRNSYMKIMGKR